jgi:hypothetical protein
VAADQSWDETYAMPDADLFLAEQQAVTFGQPGAWFQLAIPLRTGGGPAIARRD